MWLKSLGRDVLGAVTRRFGYELVYARGAATNNADWTVYNAWFKGRRFRCFRNSELTVFMLTGRGWDPVLPQALSECFSRKAGRMVIEVGANVGASLIPVCSEFPDAVFHMFEPMAEFFALLKENRESYEAWNAHLHPCAISDRDDGTVDIQYTVGNAGARLLDRPALDTRTIRTSSLDSLFPEENIAFLKVDVDGYENQVLRGAQALLKRCQPDVFMEFHVTLMRSVNTRPADVLGLLMDCGLRRFDVFSNEGATLERRVDAERVLAIADARPPYVDILAKTSESG